MSEEPMSDRGDRALEAAAEALKLSVNPRYVYDDEWPWLAQVTVAAYLDALLGELPEEAVEAARHAAEEADTVVDEVPAAIRASFRSLRDSI